MRGLELISLEKCKEIELDMFRQIIKVCEKYKLRYILDYGTLIGAVRHGGFIPWDDDIDISMPRPDYNVFKQVFDKETEDSRYCHPLYSGGAPGYDYTEKGQKRDLRPGALGGCVSSGWSGGQRGAAKRNIR